MVGFRLRCATLNDNNEGSAVEIASRSARWAVTVVILEARHKVKRCITRRSRCLPPSDGRRSRCLALSEELIDRYRRFVNTFPMTRVNSFGIPVSWICFTDNMCQRIDVSRFFPETNSIPPDTDPVVEQTCTTCKYGYGASTTLRPVPAT